MKKPIIGITLDYEKRGEYSKFPWYAIRKNYLQSIEDVGGFPLPLLHSLENIEDISNIIDGLVITGGNFDINPSLYGDINNNSRNNKNLRTAFELALCKKCLEKNIPIFGICGGEQLINVALGGTLIQDIKSLNLKTLEHEQLSPRNQTSHKVYIEYNTILHKIIGKKFINVNSAHHQAVDKLGKDVIVSSKAKDGIIESIESVNYRWCIGVQWHPEFFITKADKLIFLDFLKNCKIK